MRFAHRKHDCKNESNSANAVARSVAEVVSESDGWWQERAVLSLAGWAASARA